VYAGIVLFRSDGVSYVGRGGAGGAGVGGWGGGGGLGRGSTRGQQPHKLFSPGTDRVSLNWGVTITIVMFFFMYNYYNNDVLITV
jgi:hypothetical protein